MFGRNALLLFFSIIFVEVAPHVTKNADNYGPYKMELPKYSECKGPKAMNMSILTRRLGADGTDVFNLTVFADTKLEEIKIRVYNIKDNKKNFLWNYKLTDPCKHFSIALLIQKNLKAEKCFITKGLYSNHINMMDVMLSFLGPSFFYGNYTFRADLSSKKGNIGCVTCTWVITKKT